MTHTDQCARMRPVLNTEPLKLTPRSAYRRLQWAGIVAQTRWTGPNVVTIIAGPKTHLYMTAREFADLCLKSVSALEPRLLAVGNWTLDITQDAGPSRYAPRINPRPLLGEDLLRLVTTADAFPEPHTARRERLIPNGESLSGHDTTHTTKEDCEPCVLS